MNILGTVVAIAMVVALLMTTVIPAANQKR